MTDTDKSLEAMFKNLPDPVGPAVDLPAPIEYRRPRHEWSCPTHGIVEVYRTSARARNEGLEHMKVTGCTTKVRELTHAAA